MKTFEQLKVGDKIYIYNSLLKSMLMARVESTEQLKSKMLKICYSNDKFDEDYIVLTNTGKIKSRINLNDNIIFSTEPIQ